MGNIYSFGVIRVNLTCMSKTSTYDKFVYSLSYGGKFNKLRCGHAYANLPYPMCILLDLLT